MGLFNKIKENLGAAQPPSISIQGNKFTLRDAAGNERPPVDTLDVIFVDANANTSKVYRENRKYNPNDPTPPDCYSDNGIAPSSYALKPQSDRCVDCKWNARGSRISDVSGAAVKACDDQQKLALVVANDPQNILYRFVVTPGSLANFRAYSRTVNGHGYDLDNVVTRLSFVPKAVGVIAFDAEDRASDALLLVVQTMQDTPAAKFVTGEDDTPRGLPKPEERVQIDTDYGRKLADETPPMDTQAGVRHAQEQAGPTREQLEATLAAKRAAEAPVKGRPKIVKSEEIGDRDVPAFLKRGGMVSNPPPPSEEVSRLIEAQAGPNPLADRLNTAFKLPTRSA